MGLEFLLCGLLIFSWELSSEETPQWFYISLHVLVTQTYPNKTLSVVVGFKIHIYI